MAYDTIHDRKNRLPAIGQSRLEVEEGSSCLVDIGPRLFIALFFIFLIEVFTEKHFRQFFQRADCQMARFIGIDFHIGTDELRFRLSLSGRLQSQCLQKIPYRLKIRIAEFHFFLQLLPFPCEKFLIMVL